MPTIKSALNFGDCDIGNKKNTHNVPTPQFIPLSITIPTILFYTYKLIQLISHINTNLII